MTKPELGHFRAQGVHLMRRLREFPVSEDALLPVGTRISVRHFLPGQYVDITGITRGKGFQVNQFFIIYLLGSFSSLNHLLILGPSYLPGGKKFGAWPYMLLGFAMILALLKRDSQLHYYCLFTD